jgi:CRISPR/Cas system-associated protein endoribonuclease Cas2
MKDKKSEEVTIRTLCLEISRLQEELEAIKKTHIRTLEIVEEKRAEIDLLEGEILTMQLLNRNNQVNANERLWPW